MIASQGTELPAPDSTSTGSAVTSLEVDSDLNPNSYGDDDSIFSRDSSSYTTSLASSVYNYKYENGRRYHAFREGQYLFPNDEVEQKRLDLVHHLFRLTINGEIHRAPLVNPQKVLDLGTGTGIWAIEFADQFPESEVIGIDLSPIQPTFVPPNCKFIVDDIEAPWPYHEDEKFDYIHVRCMCGAIGDWAGLLAQIYKHLKPGGYLEFQEFEAWLRSDDGSMEKAAAIRQWQEYLDEASTKFGKRMNVAREIGGYMIDAGFTKVIDEGYKIPIGPWAKSPEKKVLGYYQLAEMLDGVEPIALAMFTRVLGHSYEETQALNARVRAEMKDPNLHIYGYYRFIYGQKEEDPDQGVVEGVSAEPVPPENINI